MNKQTNKNSTITAIMMVSLSIALVYLLILILAVFNVVDTGTMCNNLLSFVCSFKGIDRELGKYLTLFIISFPIMLTCFIACIDSYKTSKVSYK